MPGRSLRVSCFIWPLLTLVVCSHTSAQISSDSPRVSTLVKVIREMEPAVLALFVLGSETNESASGSGTIIHPDGYVLTNNHVVQQPTGFAVYRNKPVRFVVVGRLPEKDIAVLRLLGVTTPMPVVPLGHSHDLMNGESVVVSGNPGGRGIVFTSGIISSKRVLLNASNALAMTQFQNSRRDEFIQFDAASNRGNSGGPLVNMEGEVIGVVSRLILQEQNVGFAIPIDRVRELLERCIEPELIHQKSVGVRLSPLADKAIVTDVVVGSAGARAGLKSGDEIRSVYGSELRHAADWTISLDRWLPSGKPMTLLAIRDGHEMPMTLQLDRKPPLPAAAPESIGPGIEYKFFHGKFNQLPDFSDLSAERSGIVNELDLDSIRGDRKEEFAVSLRGWLEIQHDGLYRITITSDDGSSVFLHDKQVIDHDGNHPPTQASRLVRLKAGMHPVRIEYYQGSGGLHLQVQLARLVDGVEKSSEVRFFH